MSENPQCPSHEEVIESLKRWQRSQWKFIASFLFGPIGDDKTYRANDLRDRLWIMWCMARAAAQEQFLDELHPIVQELYNERKEDPKVAAEREPPQAPQRSRFSFSFHRDGPESGTE